MRTHVTKREIESSGSDRARHRRELKLEAAAWEEGEERLKKAGPNSFLGAFKRDFLQPILARVVQEQTQVLAPGKKGGRFSLDSLPLISLEAGKLALIAVTCMLNAVSKRMQLTEREPSRIDVAVQIGLQCYRARKTQRWRLRMLRLRNRRRNLQVMRGFNKFRLNTGYVRIQKLLLETRLSQSSNKSQDRLKARQYAERVDAAWNDTQRLWKSLGVQLIEWIMEATDFFLAQSDEDDERGARQIKSLSLSEQGEKWMEAHLDRRKRYEPFDIPINYPMLVLPRPWCAATGGGYLVPHLRKKLFTEKFNNYRPTKREMVPSEILDAVNALQATSWRVNQNIFTVMKAFLDPHWVSVRKKLFPGMQYKGYRVLISRRMDACETKFTDDPFYLPYQLDFRGRVYPVPLILSPQADDAGRALLEFAEGRPVAKKALAIYLANTYGKDKVSIKERLRWIEENEGQILALAEEPLQPGNHEFWLKASDPWLFLASCLEWRAWKKDPNHRSHLPIYVDGRCNGLQHLSALILDKTTAQRTNVLPSDVPNDLYTDVAGRVRKALQESSRPMVERCLPLLEAYAKDHPGIWRNLSKPCVMTIPYGISNRGMKRALGRVLKKEALEEKMLVVLANRTRREKKATKLHSVSKERRDRDASVRAKEEYSALLGTMAREMRAAVRKTAPRAVAVMEWLKQVATIYYKEFYKKELKEPVPLCWTNPVGLEVRQDYRRIQVDPLRNRGVKRNLGVEPQSDDKPASKQKRAIIANFVHSLDSAHLVRVVNRLSKAGIGAIGVIHDSFAVHSCFVSKMHRFVREEFVGVYKQPRLQLFYESLRQQNPEIVIPKPPPSGDLKIREVLKSIYFFS